MPGPELSCCPYDHVCCESWRRCELKGADVDQCTEKAFETEADGGKTLVSLGGRSSEKEAVCCSTHAAQARSLGMMR